MQINDFVKGYLESAMTVELPEAKPRPGATEGDPHETQMVLYEDDLVTIGVWECTPGRFPGDRDGYNEVMFFLQGKGTLASNGGEVRSIEPGTVFPSLDGWQGEWNLTETTRKAWVVWGRKKVG